MTYNIHLWLLDGDGRWLQYAVAKKRDGNMTTEHDTRSHLPQLSFANSVVGFGIPTPESAMNAIALFNMVIRGHLPDVNVRNEIAKTINRSNFNIDHAIALINPTPPTASDNAAEGIGSCFISGLLSFPRFILPSGKIVIGGIDYLNFWMDGTPLPTHQKFTTPEELIADERRQRGGFDETVCKFRDVVKWIGEVTHTNKAAQLAVMKIDALVQAFRTTNLYGISYLDDAANDAESALQLLCADLAEAKAAAKARNEPESAPRCPRKYKRCANGMTLKKAAALFNAKAVPLIKGGTSDDPIYEKKRGGGGGYCMVGTITERTMKSWRKKYPDEFSKQPDCQFHAGLLEDEHSINECVKRWGEYAQRYAAQYYEWRQHNKAAPRASFRYQPA